MLKREFTAVYQKRGGRYIAWIEEIPGVNTQGRTKKEVKENLRDAFGLILKVNSSISKKRLGLRHKSQLQKEIIQIAVPA
ncbi:type II toxin-antitoxin system HicB family antitoxin [Patescibacteria group bacterium]|nr:type II toxin-antitoxin system HicB family antitoxin [Patescibacteria group bacterium]MBU2633060.1 type II toxin-antitoxin system HicB family antitoxin [Patescibacteria group bacterium]